MTHHFGSTPNFTVDTEDKFWSGLTNSEQANITANANYLIGQMEAAFATTTGWFATPSGKFGSANPQKILLDRNFDGGGTNNGYGKPIYIDPQQDNATIATAGPIVSMVWMNEWSEVLMSLTGRWNAVDSSGEGLSQYCGLELFREGHYDYYNSANNQIWVENWLNGEIGTNAARSDWVNTTFTGGTFGGQHVNGDGDPVSFGCALAFLYYLTVQLTSKFREVVLPR